MAKQQIMLYYPVELLSEPIIYTMSQEFNLITNIRQANITDEVGWMILELVGGDEDIADGIAWATSKGMRVDLVDG